MSNSSIDRFWKKYQSDRQYQYRVLAIAAGLLFFVLPALVGGSLVLYEFFVDSSGAVPTIDGEIIWPDFINRFVPRVAIIGILFGIGLFILLYASNGMPDLENVFIALGFVLICGAVIVGARMSYKCSTQVDCKTFKLVAGVACVFVVSIIAYIIPVTAGKKIGWYALILVPLLLYQASILLPIAMNGIAPADTEEYKALKNTILMFTTASLIAWIGLAGGWPRSKPR